MNYQLAIYITINVLLCKSLYSQVEFFEMSKNDLIEASRLYERNNITGFVTSRYYYNEENKTDISKLYQATLLDTNGLILSTINFDSKKHRLNYFFFERYNDCKIYRKYPLPMNKGLNGMEEYYYDSKGELIEIAFFSKGKTIQSRFLLYRSTSGILQKIVELSYDNKILETRYYYFKDKNLVIDVYNSNIEDSLLRKDIIHYNKEKLPVERRLINYKTKDEQKFIYTYSKNQLLLKIEYFQNSKRLYVDEVHYIKSDAKRNLIESGFDMSNYIYSIGPGENFMFYSFNQCNDSNLIFTIQKLLETELMKSHTYFERGVVIIMLNFDKNGEKRNVTILRNVSKINNQVIIKSIEEIIRINQDLLINITFPMQFTFPLLLF